MRIIRFLGNIALWVGACLGVIAGSVWIGGQLGWIQPLIVISGSMEPDIDTGDLLFDRWMSTADLEVGDVVSLPSSVTDKLVTHRIVSITPTGDTWEIRMKGDANPEDDIEPYIVGDKVLTPVFKVPGGGTVVSELMEPAVALPILVALVALLGVSLLDEEPRRVIRRTVERVARRCPRLDELDRELAAVGIDVARFEQMDDLDLALFAVGIDVRHLDAPPGNDPHRSDHRHRSDHPHRSDHRRRSLDLQPALTG